MKIAIDITPIHNKFSAHSYRGAGFYIQNLCRSLAEYVPEHTYTFFSHDNPISVGVDVVHYPYFDPFFVTMPWKKIAKTVVTIHDLIPLLFPHDFPVGIKGNLKWQIQKFFLRQANLVITDSLVSKNDISKITRIAPSKIKSIPLAAGNEFRKLSLSRKKQESFSEKYNLPDKFVLYVGDATKNKNLPRLVQAIKEINLTLVMVGKAISSEVFDKQNPWNSDLILTQELIKNDKRFIRLGFIPTEDLVVLYNMAMVFIFPSLYEGFGLPVLEAMSCGCPVITTKAGSLEGVAGDSAFYVDPNNVSSIANGIGEVYFSKELQDRLCKKGINQAKKFSWRNTAMETIAAYEKSLRM